MGEILGLGITHYPNLATKLNMSWRFQKALEDQTVPERFRSMQSWHPTMREQWGNDRGAAHSERHRADLIAHFRKARRELDAFKPDFVLIWGDDQYRELPRRLRAGVLYPCLQRGRAEALERLQPRTQRMGRAGGDDLRRKGTSRGGQIPGDRTAQGGHRSRLRLQAVCTIRSDMRSRIPCSSSTTTGKDFHIRSCRSQSTHMAAG